MVSFDLFLPSFALFYNSQIQSHLPLSRRRTHHPLHHPSRRSPRNLRTRPPRIDSKERRKRCHRIQPRRVAWLKSRRAQRLQEGSESRLVGEVRKERGAEIKELTVVKHAGKMEKKRSWMDVGRETKGGELADEIDELDDWVFFLFFLSLKSRWVF